MFKKWWQGVRLDVLQREYDNAEVPDFVDFAKQTLKPYKGRSSPSLETAYIQFLDKMLGWAYIPPDNQQRFVFLERLLETLKTDDHMYVYLSAMQEVYEFLIRRVPKEKGRIAYRASVPLVYLLPKPEETIIAFLAPFLSDRFKEVGLLPFLQEHMADLPAFDDYHGDDVYEDYLGGTPFYDLLYTNIDLPISQTVLFNHVHVCAATGGGKTSWIADFILQQMQQKNPPSLVVVDSQSQLIPKLARLECMRDRAILIDPTDVEHPPAINIFDLGGRIDDQAQREQRIASAIETVEYLMSNILQFSLTAKQGILFRHTAWLMLTLPVAMGRNATILDVLKLMEDVEPYREAIKHLPPVQRSFFEKEFAKGKKGQFASTREEVAYRLHGILENPTMVRLLTAPETKLNLNRELSDGCVLLVDTSEQFLSGATAHYGRTWISFVLKALLERGQYKKQTYLVVDEAWQYMDENVSDLLVKARKQGCGCVFAHQDLHQSDAKKLTAPLMTNTYTKVVTELSHEDARRFAPNMETDVGILKHYRALQFAFFSRGLTPAPVPLQVDPILLDSQPRQSEADYEAFLERNRRRISLGVEEPEEEPPKSWVDDDVEV